MYSGKKAQHDFPKMRGGGDQRPFGTFPKIHPFWYSRPSLTYPRLTFLYLELLGGVPVKKHPVSVNISTCDCAPNN